MDLMYESGLFSELGEVVGYDPVLYEDTPKQHFINTSFPADGFQRDASSNLDGSAMPGNFEMDSLLAENNQLLDELLSANCIDLPIDDPVDMAAIDEVSANMEYLQEHIDVLEDHEHLLADLESLAAPVDNEYPEVVSPSSSIDTLPSEPSSPVDLLSFCEPEPILVQQQQQAPELNDLLQSLLDENDNTPSALYEPEPYNDESMQSPSASEQSFSTTYTDESWTESSLSPCSSEGLDRCEAPSRLKSKKKSRSTPYSKLPAGRKERKKKQNKEAAIRYREKKRKEAQNIQGEEDLLVQRNNELKTEVLNLEREIMCMKELLSDVFNIHSL